jgi:hypothetical protein
LVEYVARRATGAIRQGAERPRENGEKLWMRCIPVSRSCWSDKRDDAFELSN